MDQCTSLAMHVNANKIYGKEMGHRGNDRRTIVFVKR